MNKKQYEEKRRSLINEVQACIENGDAEGAEEKMGEVRQLDENWDAIATAQANFNALNKEPEGLTLFGQNEEAISFSGENLLEDNMYDSTEYRTAFMNYVVNGTKIPEKFRNENEVTKTTDVGAVISPTVVNKIIEKMETTGMILPLVTKTAYAAGTVVPTSLVKPIATWVAEGGTSDKQKKTTGSIDFKGYKLRCAISMTLETSVMSLKVFETVFISNVTEAMVKAIETAIIKGDGNGKPKGVLKEEVKEGQSIEIAAKTKVTYNTLIKAEAALPLAYENGAVWNMTKKTFMEFVGMVDSAGQPIARENYGLNGKPERMLLGRRVVLNEYMDALEDEVTEDTPVAFLFSWSDYIFNTNYGMTVKSYEDNDNEDKITKAVMICDGKPVSVESLVVITKKKAAG